MKNREEIINKVVDAWVLQGLLYDSLEAFDDDEVFDKTLDVIDVFANIIYKLVGIDEEEREEIQEQAYKKCYQIRNIINKSEQ